MQPKENITKSLLDKKEKKKEKKPSISIWRLLFHLSSKKEIILMLLGTFGSIISAIAGPIMSYNFGGAINDFSDIQNLEEIDKNSEIIKSFTNNINKIINKYLILGSILFISNFYKHLDGNIQLFFKFII